MISSTKQKLHNVLQHCQRRTESWPQSTCFCTKNLVKFNHTLSKICKNTDRQTDILVTVFCIPPADKVHVITITGYWDQTAGFIGCYTPIGAPKGRFQAILLVFGHPTCLHLPGELYRGHLSLSVFYEQAFCMEVARGIGNVYSRTSHTMMMMMMTRLPSQVRTMGEFHC